MSEQMKKSGENDFQGPARSQSLCENGSFRFSRYFRRAIQPLSFLLLLIVFAFGSSTFAQTTSAPVQNIILVHGAWADGTCWSKVIPMLEAKGLHVTAVQIPLTSLADDVATTQRAIALQDGPVILVGHSYGGVVITEAGNDPKVVGLVYIAAFAPDAGENAFGLGKPYPPTPLGPELRPDAQGFLKVTPDGIAKDFAQDLSPAEIKIVTAVQGPTNVAVLQANVTTAAWKTKPTWFAVAANDRAIPPELEKAEAARMKATTITLSSSHVAMLAKPAEVSALIEKAAAGVGPK
jgi:pimeloyl-ACP methyl ester carboxylesterase